jgi:putative PIG3 family NAD(P)H quinone oxidoreductase
MAATPLQPGMVQIEIAAAGVNRADLLQASGNYAPPPGESPTLGLECSGRIIASQDERWRVGDEVCALLGSGGYGSSVTVDGGVVFPLPKDVSLIEAAALPEVVCTVWSNLFMLAGLRPNEHVLIHGGGSGIGTMAIQLAKAMDARVTTTARSTKHEALIALGADTVVDYIKDDFVKHGPYDVILDHIGAKYFERNIEALSTNGRLAIIGLMGGTTASIDLGTLLRKRAAVLGTTLRARPIEEKRAICASVREHVWPLIDSGKVRPMIDRVLPMAEWKEAHGVLERSEHVGKVLLVNE